MLKPLAIVVALLIGRVLAFGAGGADTRFSQAITPEERQEIGLAKLNSDQIAILDALVRRDITDRMLHQPEPNTPAAFSDRLTADEQKSTGIATMSPEQRNQLNATVARVQVGGQTQTLMTNPVFLPRTGVSLARETGKKEKRGLETHGSVSLSYGWGSGGYSTRSGSMIVNMTDPDKKYSITIGYGETHVKGPAGRPAVLLDGLPYYGDDLLRP